MPLTQTDKELLIRVLIDELTGWFSIVVFILVLLVLAGAFVAVKYWLFPWITKNAQISLDKAAAGFIAHAQEAAKAPFAIDAENRRARHELRTAALDRRLDIHQQAFSLWRKLVVAMQTNSLPPVEMECDEWWYKNCLYLEPSIRDEFLLVVNCAAEYVRQLKSRSNTSRLEGAFDRVAGFGDKILAAMALPPLSSEASESIRAGNS